MCKKCGGKKTPRAKSAPRFPGFLRMEKSGMKLLPSEERIPGGRSDPSPIPGFGRGAGPEPLPKIFSNFGEFFGIFAAGFALCGREKVEFSAGKCPILGGFGVLFMIRSVPWRCKSDFWVLFFPFF